MPLTAFVMLITDLIYLLHTHKSRVLSAPLLTHCRNAKRGHSVLARGKQKRADTRNETEKEKEHRKIQFYVTRLSEIRKKHGNESM
jgi:hypothetical protein